MKVPVVPLWFGLVVVIAAFLNAPRATEIVQGLCCQTEAQLLETYVGGDFRFFWGEGRVLRHEGAGAAYNGEALARGSQFPIPKVEPLFYPPAFIMTLLPSGYIDYLSALRIHAVAETLLLVGASIMAVTLEWPLVLLFTLTGAPLWLSLYTGQNSVYFSVCMLLAYCWLDRAPRRAGVVLAMAGCKPHLVFLVPVLLLVHRRFKIIFAGIGAFLVLSLLPYFILGPDIYLSYWGAIQRLWIRTTDFDIHNKVAPNSFYFSLLRQGLAPQIVTTLYLSFLVLCGGLYLRFCQKNASLADQFSLLPLLTLLILPHSFPYDLVFLQLPLLVFLKFLLKPSATWQDRSLWAAFVLGIIFTYELNRAIGMNFTPLLGLLLLWRAPVIIRPSPNETVSPSYPTAK